MMKVKCNLLNIRKKKNLRQTELSKLCGISQKALSELETGKSKGISFGTLEKLCEVLQVNINELFEVSSESNDSEETIMTVVEKPSCSFCNKKESEVETLIMGKVIKDKPLVYICSECVKRSNNLIENK